MRISDWSSDVCSSDLDGDTPAALCIHFDAAKLPLPRLREMVRAADAEITERYGHAIWQVTGISHERRARTVSDALCPFPGGVQARPSTSRAGRGSGSAQGREEVCAAGLSSGEG